MSKSKKHIFFCPSYTAINQTLEVISTLSPNEKKIIIVSESGIYSIFKKYKIDQHYDIVYYPRINISVASPLLVKFVWYRFLNNLVYKRHFSKFQNCEVYFFNHLFWDFGLKIIQKLSRENKLYFYNLFPMLSQINAQPVLTFFLNHVFGLKFAKVVMRGNFPCSAITSDFIKRNQIKRLKPVINKQKFRKLSTKLFGGYLDKHKILIILDAGQNQTYFDPKKYIKNITQIVSYLRKFYKQREILLKPHPRIPLDLPKNLEKYVDENLSALPAELLIHSKLKVIIGTASTTFAYEGFSNKNCLKISLVNYIFKDTHEAVYIKSYFQEISKDVLLPNSFEDFKQIFERK